MNLASSLKGCRSWDDLQKRWKDCDKKTKGDLFEALVKNYLLLTPEFASKFKAVWGFKEIPSSVLQKLKLPSADKGIDLIAETKEGDYWAIQCKYREDSSDQITWREISTFMGLYLGRKQISFGLIASTTERITKVLKDHDRVGFLAYDVWQGLDEEFFKRLQARLYKKKEPLKARLPRPHQKEAIRDAIAYFKKRGNSRGKLIMPCGTGKSLTSFFIAEKLKAQRVLIAVPSLSLIRQTLKEWMRESLARNNKVEWICVCSDESAGKIDQDDAVVLTQDLGVPCLTDPKQIASWLKRKHRARTIVFTTYQSGQALAKACRNAAFAFDLGIMDEAHKTAGAKDRVFSHLVLNKNINITRRIFMTATERRYLGKSEEILSMEDPDQYGKTIHKLSFKKALEYKPAILSDYKVVTIHISKEEIRNLVRNRAFVRPKTKGWSKEMGAENLAALVALRKAMKKYPIRHAVSFHSSIRRAQEFKERNVTYSKTFALNESIETFHVSGKTPTGTRAREIDQFSKASKGLITNARCLTEGVDVPNIDAILFADPRKSLVDIVQAVGRALRPSLNKKYGYIVIPVVHSKNAKIDEVLNSISFGAVLTTLRALGSQDERIIEYFRVLAQGRTPKTGRIFECLIAKRMAKKIDFRNFVRSIEVRCWARLAKLSWMPFDEARKYVRRLGLRSSSHWRKYAFGKYKIKKPSDIPTNPNKTYADSGWVNFGDWLGTGEIAPQKRQFMKFKEARSFVRSLKLKNSDQWAKYFSLGLSGKPKCPKNIPSNPQRVYRNDGYKGMGDWLGTGRIANQKRKYLSFFKARSYVRKLKLKNLSEWQRYCCGKDLKKRERPFYIPSQPAKTYKNNGFKGIGDWLGTKKLSNAERARRAPPYKIAKKIVRGLKIKSKTEWEKYIILIREKGGRVPGNIPHDPRRTYQQKGQWIGWGDFLGTGNIASFQKKFLKFRQATKIVKKLGILTKEEWRKQFKKISKKHPGLHSAPDRKYKHCGWKNWGHFLGVKQ